MNIKPTLLTLIVSILGCNRQINLDDDGAPTPDLPEDTPDLPAGCDEPMLDCGSGCVDPMTDPMHCGGCSSRCRIIESGPTMTGGCEQGSCLPSLYECEYQTDQDPGRTCEEICGATVPCAENACAGFTVAWVPTYIGDPFPCDPVDLASESIVPQQLSCDTPLGEAMAAAGLPPLNDDELVWRASCCCDYE